MKLNVTKLGPYLSYSCKIKFSKSSSSQNSPDRSCIDFNLCLSESAKEFLADGVLSCNDSTSEEKSGEKSNDGDRSISGLCGLHN